MRIGKFDQRITVVRATVASQNTFGEDVAGVDEELVQFWASVESGGGMNGQAGRELWKAQQRWAEARYVITMRRQPAINLKRSDSLLWNSQTLDILDIQGQGTRQQAWTIIARDHVA